MKCSDFECRVIEDEFTIVDISSSTIFCGFTSLKQVNYKIMISLYIIHPSIDFALMMWSFLSFQTFDRERSIWEQKQVKKNWNPKIKSIYSLTDIFSGIFEPKKKILYVCCRFDAYQVLMNKLVIVVHKNMSKLYMLSMLFLV